MELAEELENLKAQVVKTSMESFQRGVDIGKTIERDRILALIEIHTYKYNDNHIMFLQRDELLKAITHG